MTITIKEMENELYKAFDIFNKRYFEKKLPVTMITIQSSEHQKLSMGWCTTDKRWSDKDNEIAMYEINISPEHINISFYETMDTLLHEMVHLYNIVHEIQDVSRNKTYHNKEFKKRAIQSGFGYDHDKPDKQYGWSYCKITEATKRIIDEMPLDQKVFSLGRKSGGVSKSVENEEEGDNETKKKTSYKWYCTECDQIVRSSKPDINIICGRCRVKMVSDDIE